MRLLTAPPHSLAVFSEVRSASEHTMRLVRKAPVGLQEVAEGDGRGGCLQAGLSHNDPLVY